MGARMAYEPETQNHTFVIVTEAEIAQALEVARTPSEPSLATRRRYAEYKRRCKK